MRNALILFLLTFTQSLLAQSTTLFKIVQHDRVGYINDKGKIVIEPRFLSANDFVDGLAAVREEGLYGFIDESGKFVIQPAYDFATYFFNGLAVVYKDGQSFVINKSGKPALPVVYKSLTFIDSGKAIVTTATNKQGVMDVVTKKLLIDTVFGSIGKFNNGVAVVSELVNSSRVGVLGINGDMVVPFGKYDKIKPFVDGCAVVECRYGGINERAASAIDTLGHLLFDGIKNNKGYIGSSFCDGFAKMSFYRNETSMVKDYEGFINLKGEKVFGDATYTTVNEFSNGRAFVRKHGDYILIDRHFNRIGNSVYNDVLNDYFQDGYAIVATNEGYGIIDTMANIVVKPQYKRIHPIGIINGYFFFSTDGELYGVADIQGNVIANNTISEFDKSGFFDGLLRVAVDGRLQYINKKGKIVWEEREERSTGLQPLNIDYMNRAYFYAYSSQENLSSYSGGGWAISSNVPEKITAQQFPDHKLAVTINTTKIDSFGKKYMGYELSISNTTIDTMRFNAQDSRLDLHLQAQDKSGAWKDIEYLPGSWCGNSYHKVQLFPNEFWRFTIPKYHGAFKTNIRAVLKVIDNLHPEEEKTVYSNTIKGSINPGQFWNKRTYYRNGMMDPYNE